MGFDPRRWSSAAEAHRRQTVTSNVDALLAENDSLRREVLQLKKQIDVLRQRQWTQSHSRRQQRSNAQQHEPEQKSPSRMFLSVEYDHALHLRGLCPRQQSLQHCLVERLVRW